MSCSLWCMDCRTQEADAACTRSGVPTTTRAIGRLGVLCDVAITIDLREVI